MSIGHLRLLKLQPRSLWLILNSSVLQRAGNTKNKQTFFFFLKNCLGFRSLMPSHLSDCWWIVPSAGFSWFCTWHCALLESCLIWEMCLEISLFSSNASSVQFSSVAQLYSTLCDPVDCSTPGLPIHHQLPEFTQTHVHWVADAIQPSHPLSFSSSSSAFSLSQHQGLFQWVGSSHQVTKVGVSASTSVLQWTFRVDFL